MNFARKQLNKGFTLVEMLIYMAVLLVLSTAAVTFMISFDDLLSQYRVDTELYRSGTNVMEQIVLSLRQANTFNSVGSVLNDSDGVLSVETASGTVIFDRDGSDLDLSIAGTDYGNLVSDAVTVTNFTVYEYATAVGSMIRVKLSLSATVNGVSKDTTLYGGSVVRGDL